LISDALRRAGYDIRIANIQEWLRDTPKSRELCADTDLIVIQRVLVEESLKQVEFWKQRGKAVTADADDGYDFVDPTNLAYEFWMRGSVTINTPYGSYKTKLDRHPLTQFHEGLSMVTAMTVPSRQLVRDWQQFGRIRYLANYMKSSVYLDQPRQQNDHIVIGFGGSLGHTESFIYSGIRDALQRILHEYDNIRVMIIGDKRIADGLPLPKHKLIFRNYVPYNEWSSVLAGYDIGVAPLASKFDMRRSHIKILEYMLMGIPFVATGDSTCRVYEDFYNVDSGTFVSYGDETNSDTYDKRVDEWYGALKKTIDNLSDYRECAKANVERAMEWDVDANVGNIVKTYEEILNLR
jgi:glycosyltransferase involved in cell wall biosynthesis